MRPNPTYCPIKVPRRHVRYAETYVRATLYVSPYLVATPKGYTKHYYAESERVASRTGAGMDSVNLFLSNLADYRESSVSLNSPAWQESLTTEEDFLAKYDTIEWQLDHVVYECLWTYPNVVFDSLNILYSYANLSPYQHENEPDCYWYHPDHLGSSSWITFSDGKAVEHLHYMPWGEDFVRQRSTDWNAMYTFSAKEKDTETGYSYFGSRYYNSDLSIWLSVDPMSDKYPSLSPYVYCANNPVKLVDPNGEDAKKPPLFNRINSLNPQEKHILLYDVRFLTAISVNKNAEVAASMAKQAYSGEGSKGGKTDAYRHAMWQALNVQSIGEKMTRKWSDAHEYSTPLDELNTDLIMDIHNNDVGIEIGKQNPNATPEQLGEIIKQRIDNGDMIVIEKDKKGNDVLKKSNGEAIEQSEIRNQKTIRKISNNLRNGIQVSPDSDY